MRTKEVAMTMGSAPKYLFLRLHGFLVVAGLQDQMAQPHIKYLVAFLGDDASHDTYN